MLDLRVERCPSGSHPEEMIRPGGFLATQVPETSCVRAPPGVSLVPSQCRRLHSSDSNPGFCLVRMTSVAVHLVF
jgi:hypothetical protein